VSSNYLTKHMLRRGKPFDGELKAPASTQKILQKLKRIAACLSAK
jgi:hypothetical protein